jgi:hypothetical protein
MKLSTDACYRSSAGGTEGVVPDHVCPRGRGTPQPEIPERIVQLAGTKTLQGVGDFDVDRLEEAVELP